MNSKRKIGRSPRRGRNNNSNDNAAAPTTPLLAAVELPVPPQSSPKCMWCHQEDETLIPYPCIAYHDTLRIHRGCMGAMIYQTRSQHHTEPGHHRTITYFYNCPVCGRHNNAEITKPPNTIYQALTDALKTSRWEEYADVGAVFVAFAALLISVVVIPVLFLCAPSFFYLSWTVLKEWRAGWTGDRYYIDSMLVSLVCEVVLDIPVFIVIKDRTEAHDAHPVLTSPLFACAIKFINSYLLVLLAGPTWIPFVGYGLHVTRLLIAMLITAFAVASLMLCAKTRRYGTKIEGRMRMEPWFDEYITQDSNK